jgi:hypothetical protein
MPRHIGQTGEDSESPYNFNDNDSSDYNKAAIHGFFDRREVLVELVIRE